MKTGVKSSQSGAFVLDGPCVSMNVGVGSEVPHLELQVAVTLLLLKRRSRHRCVCIYTYIYTLMIHVHIHFHPHVTSHEPSCTRLKVWGLAELEKVLGFRNQESESLELRTALSAPVTLQLPCLTGSVHR